MVQVKAFEENSLEDLEDQINNLLDDDSILLINALYSTTVLEEEIFYSALIFYKNFE